MRTTLCLLLLGVAGCGAKYHPVTGRVHFPDGSPLEVGRVVVDFGEAKSGAWGSIHPDGTFTIGTDTPSDGMLPGTYRVYISGAETLPGPGTPSRPLVHSRFTKAETSGLQFTVPGDSTWDIVVEKPER